MTRVREERVRETGVGVLGPRAHVAVERHAVLGVVDAGHRQRRIRVPGVGRGELHRDRAGVRAAHAGSGGIERDRRGRRDGLLVGVERDLHDLRRGGGRDVVAAAGDRVAGHVERAVVAELRADDQAVLLGDRRAGLVVRQPVLHAQHLVVVLAQPDFLPEAGVGAAVVDEPRAVVVAREGAGTGGARVAEDRARDRLHAALGQITVVGGIGPAGGVGVLLPDRRRDRLRDRVQTVERRVDRRLAVGRVADVGRDLVQLAVVLLPRRRAGGVVPLVVGVLRGVVAHAERPTEVAGLADQVPLADAGRRTVGTVGGRVVAVLAHADQCPGSSGPSAR